MRLKNGANEAQVVINVTMLALRDLKGDLGPDGLKLARRVAMGGSAKNNPLDTYGLTAQGGMSQGVKNVILSAVSARGELGNPLA